MVLGYKLGRDKYDSNYHYIDILVDGEVAVVMYKNAYDLETAKAVVEYINKYIDSKEKVSGKNVGSAKIGDN